MSFIQRRFFLIVLLLAWIPVSQAADLADREQEAIRKAVDRAAPAVVRIETIGGQEFVDGIRLGVAPTTGFIVDSEGFIISSIFNFLHKPDSILVRLPDGSRKPARIIAADHSRMLVLLKVDANEPLPTVSPTPPEDGTGESPPIDFVPVAQMREGQWTIAVGRTFESERPNIAVGILSAKNRVWGKAVQTDAAVSPNNYGGPLIDIRGRVLGILVPLSPQSEDVVAGVEWYDSGIGFAVPFEHIQTILPRLKNGEDLYPGRAGIALKGPNLYTGEPIIAGCHPKSPASEAGLKSGDRIVEIDGRPVARSADVRQEIATRYAGQTMRITVQREKERIDCTLTLSKDLEPIKTD